MSGVDRSPRAGPAWLQRRRRRCPRLLGRFHRNQDFGIPRVAVAWGYSSGIRSRRFSPGSRPTVGATAGRPPGGNAPPAQGSNRVVRRDWAVETCRWGDRRSPLHASGLLLRGGRVPSEVPRPREVRGSGQRPSPADLRSAASQPCGHRGGTVSAASLCRDASPPQDVRTKLWVTMRPGGEMTSAGGQAWLPRNGELGSARSGPDPRQTPEGALRRRTEARHL